MADSKITVFGDCGDERGERGERGHRGKRGHRGPQGPAADEGPPFRPPFPFPPIVTRIFARTTGSDTDGDGSLSEPYRTFQRAIRDVPDVIDPGFFYVVDITGIGVEVLPPNYALPAIQGPFGLELSSGVVGVDFPFSTVTALEIIAVPQPATAVAIADQIITTADLIGPGITSDTSTNLVEIHTNKDYGAADSLQGLFLQGSFGSSGVIWHNTAGPNTVIYVSQSVCPDQPVSQLFALPVAPLAITEPSAEFQTQKNPLPPGPPPRDILRGGFYIAGDGSLGIRGVKFQLAPQFTDPTAFDVEVFGSRTIFFECCSLDGYGMFHSGGEITFLSSIVRDASAVSQLPINFVSSMFLNIPGTATWAVPTTFKAIGFVVENCTALGPRLDAFTPCGRGPMMNLHLRNGVIHNSVPDLNYAQIADPANFPAPFVPFSLNPALATPGHGICFRNGNAFIDHVKIFGCAGDGIHVEAGNGFVEIKSITGGELITPFVFTDLPNTPNGGVGVLVTDGAFVRVSDQDPVPNLVVTTVHGATGLGDLHVGDTPGLSSTWLAFHISKQLYDITAVGPAGATGSGSRAFEKP